MTKRYVIGVTGASGSVYGAALIQALLAEGGREVHLIVSPMGARVMAQELGAQELGAEELGGGEALPSPARPFDPLPYLNLSSDQAARLIVHDPGDLAAAPASGTFRHEAMIVCPCSMKTLGALASGVSESLLARTADVALKEGRPLILVPRETPLSLIHLRNMTRLAEAGAIILPACPAFYHRPATIQDLVRFVIQKVFDRLGLDFPGAVRWRG